MKLAKLKIAVLGGDKREEILVGSLRAAGAEVLTVGYPPVEGATAMSLESAVTIADAIIAPMSNTDDEGFIRAVPTGEKLQLSGELLQKARPETPFLIA